MRLIIRCIMALGLCGTTGLSWAQHIPTAAGALQASNILNPNVSVVGWLQAEMGRRHTAPGEEPPAAAQIKEIEVAFQSVVDPYARGDVFVAIGGDGKVDLEEGYLTWFELPGQLALTMGKFRANLGRFNRIHTPETPFADRPLVHQRLIGEEGLSGTGASLSWHVPNPWLFLNLDSEVTTAPRKEDSAAFDKATRKDLLYVERLSAYRDLTEATNVTLGGSLAYGPAGQTFEPVSSSSETLHTRLYGVDCTFRWKDPRRAIYRSFLWQTEVLWNRRDVSTTSRVASRGLFSHVEWQFSRRWRVGGRYDFTGVPKESESRDRGGLMYLTFTPSEFSLISLQGRHAKLADGARETLGFLKVTFNLGPHGAHPF